jgi:exodeoxyribonuclease-3
MKIISWNVNGIRAIERKGNFSALLALDADILCLQETKAEREQLSDDIVAPTGYTSFFHSSHERKGYSGTAIYTKEVPEKIVNGLPDTPELDQQGRTLTAHYKDFILINCYFPNGASKTSPLDYKLSFYEGFLQYAEKLNKKKACDFNRRF